MDANMIRRLKPRLNKFLNEFADCFARKDTRMHLTTYVNGQLSDLHRKSVEPIALAQRMPPRTLQNFLSVLLHRGARANVLVHDDHAVVRIQNHPEADKGVGEPEIDALKNNRAAGQGGLILDVYRQFEL